MMKAMNKSTAAILRYQSELDQFWAQITELVEKDPHGTLIMVNALTKVADGSGLLVIPLNSPQMRQIAWFAVAAMTEGVYRVAQRQQEES